VLVETPLQVTNPLEMRVWLVAVMSVPSERATFFRAPVKRIGGSKRIVVVVEPDLVTKF
jgi:hypothetical protein